ncbi:MAG TPA: HAD-IC family P-type ATPase, partial [Phycisphaeraceae bacterium]
LDKTGTLTVGRIQLQAWHGSEAVKPAVLAIERHSSHPIARAIAAALLDEGVVPVEGTIQVQQTAQGGIAATVDARAVLIGSLPFVQSQGVAVTQRDRAWIDACTDRGLSPVCVARDGVIEAVIGLGDALRQDAERAIASLRAMGWAVGILSGDHPALVQRVARALQIDPAQAHGGLMPEEKLAMVEQHAARGTVVMVGDGVNDAAALAAATVGVAVHGGAEASLAASDVYLARPDLASLVELMQAARRTIGVVRRNLLASLGYNALAVSLAVAGAINPLIAAVLMPISSLTVLSLSLGARTFGSDR